jgi:hypothetical protein
MFISAEKIYNRCLLMKKPPWLGSRAVFDQKQNRNTPFFDVFIAVPEVQLQ